MANINYPFGNPSIFIVPGSASTYEYTIFNDYTIIDAKSVACTKARVLKLKFSKWLKIGAKMTILQMANGNGLTLSTGFSGLALMSAANKKMVSCEFVYDGQAFVPSGGVFTQS